MLNKNKALTNFIIGYITAVLLVVLFVTLGQTDNQLMGDVSGTTTSVGAGITFGISILCLLLVYSVTAIIFSSQEKIKKAPISILLTSLAMSLTIAFSFSVLDITLNTSYGTFIKKLFFVVVFSGSILTLLWFIQEFNTKLTMSTISNNRADEWEYSNFIKLSFNRITVKHNKDHTVLTYKGKETIVFFVSEEIIERKFLLSGDMKTKIVSDLENLATNEQKVAIVFLSNRLPIIEGESDKVSIIKNDSLIKFLKEAHNEEKK